MPPTEPIIPCLPVEVTTEVFNSTDSLEDQVSKDDLNALLYIVVTLLFYSLGIIIGIVTYLKREKEEIEEDKCFDEFLQMKRDPFNYHKMEKVHLVAARLKEMEKIKLAREEQIKKELRDEVIVEEECSEHNSEALLDPPGSPVSGSRPTDLGVLDNVDNADKKRKHIRKQHSGIFQVTPTGEPIASVVAKIFDTERRGGLQMSPKALYHIDAPKKLVSRDSSTNDSDSHSDIKTTDSNSPGGKSETSAGSTRLKSVVVTNV